MGFKGLTKYSSEQKYKLMLTAHSSINIVFLISNNPGFVSSEILCTYKWQLVATVLRQPDGGTVSGSNSIIKITFGLIYFVDRGMGNII